MKCRTSLLALLTAACCLGAPAYAQGPSGQAADSRQELEHRSRVAVDQNLADYLFLGTLNAELQYAVHRNWTLGLGARYNNWTWRHRQDAQFQSRNQTYYVAGRWWPWYT